MRRLSSHILGIDQGSVILFSDFKDGGLMWTGEGLRETRRSVTFSEPFRATPTIHVALSMWDIDQKTNQRVDISSDAITVSSFEIVFRTWGDTRVARVRADWMAIGEVSSEDDWDDF